MLLLTLFFKQHIHYIGTVFNKNTGVGGALLCKAGNTIFIPPAVINKERHRLAGVSLGFKRRRMVGHNKYAVIIAAAAQTRSIAA